jgi:hypothetical protein
MSEIKPPPEGGERPHETAQWAYYGEWIEFTAGYRRYRRRLARADDGSWERVVVEHETRNGWAHVGKRVAEGIEIGQVMAATLIEDLASELAAEVENRYERTKDHPAMAWRYERDMEAVARAREFLQRLNERGP